VSYVSDLASSPYICLINVKRRKAISGYLAFAELFSAESSILLIPLIRIPTECVMKPASVGRTNLQKTDRTGKRKEGRKIGERKGDGKGITQKGEERNMKNKVGREMS
jgi:hypothetical protein